MQLIEAMHYNFCPRCGKQINAHGWGYKVIPNGYFTEKFGICKNCDRELKAKEREERHRPRHNNNDDDSGYGLSQWEIDALLSAVMPRAQPNINETWKRYLDYKLNVVLDYQNNVKYMYYNFCSTIYGKIRPNKGFVMKDPWSGKETGRNY